MDGVGTAARTATTPRRGAPAALVAAMAFAQLGLFVALLTPVVVSLTLRVNAIVPDEERRAGALGLVLGVGAVFALVANPVVGHLSDRTTLRVGMRRPWLVVGAVGGIAGLAVVGVAPSVGVLLVGWCITQTFFNGTFAALTALMSDQIPLEQRGRVSGLLGVAQIAAVVAGTFLASLLASDPLLLMIGPAAILAVAVPVLVVVLPDRRLDPRDRPPFSLRAALATFVVHPGRHPDFAWAWLSRFLGFYGVATLLSFQALYLGARLDVPDEELAGTVLQLQLVQNLAVVVAALLAGWLSDRLGRRRWWVLAASLLQGAGLVVLALAPSLPVVLLGFAATGVAVGVFVSVELALAVSVLPDRATAAKDLGVYNIANAAPQSVAPAVGPGLLAAGGFPLLFLAAAGSAVAGGAAIMKIKGNR